MQAYASIVPELVLQLQQPWIRLSSLFMTHFRALQRSESTLESALSQALRTDQVDRVIEIRPEACLIGRSFQALCSLVSFVFFLQVSSTSIFCFSPRALHAFVSCRSIICIITRVFLVHFIIATVIEGGVTFFLMLSLCDRIAFPCT